MRLMLVAVLAVPVLVIVVLMNESGTSIFGSGTTGLDELEQGPGDALIAGDDGDGDGGGTGSGSAEAAEPTEGQTTATPATTRTSTPTPTATPTSVAAVDGSPFGGDDFVRALAAQGVEAERGSETVRCDADDDGAGVEYELSGPGSASGTVYLWVYPSGASREAHWVTGGAPTPRDTSCSHEGSFWNQNVVLQIESVNGAGLREALRSAFLTLDGG